MELTQTAGTPCDDDDGNAGCSAIERHFVVVDLTTWFRDAAGALLDPATASANGPNASRVAGNIVRSLRAVRDDERDGHDHGGDDGGHHGSDG